MCRCVRSRATILSYEHRRDHRRVAPAQPCRLAQVQARVKELVEPTRADAPVNAVAAHPALGIWKDRNDLPADSVEASAVLRDRMMRRTSASSVESADGTAS